MAFVSALEFVRNPARFIETRRAGAPRAVETQARDHEDDGPDGMDLLAVEHPVLPRGVRRG